jgi:hypothetical protein
MRMLLIAMLGIAMIGCAWDEEKYGKRYNDKTYSQWKTKGKSAASSTPAEWKVHRTLVDPKAEGYDPAQYERDNAECNRLGNKRSVGQNTADGAVGGLLVGAALGAVVGSAYNDTGYGAAYGAALGTTTGAAQGASEGIQRHDNIVRECMRGRGYTVLD